MDIIKSIEHEQMKSKVPMLKVGDSVKVHVRVKEGNRERIQVFEGIIIKKQGGGVNETFTVRRISYGVGVEKTFLLHSPTVEKIEVIRVGKARRAKLFYLRDRLGKSAKTKEQVGTRIETKEVTLKEELIEEPVVEEIPAEDVVSDTLVVPENEAPVESAPEEAPAVETEVPVEEEVVEAIEEAEEPVVEETAETEEPNNQEPTTNNNREEAPVVETEEPVIEETIDTVTEEPVETVKEEPVKKEEE